MGKAYKDQLVQPNIEMRVSGDMLQARSGENGIWLDVATLDSLRGAEGSMAPVGVNT
jgi:hypothetical protein